MVCDEAAAKAAGVDARALLFCLLAQEFLDERVLEDAQLAQSQCVGEAEAALEQLRQAATNAASPQEVEAARQAAAAALLTAGLEEHLQERLARPHAGRSEVCQEVMPGLWLGGWVALNNDCVELRRRRVTHVVSVVSADKRQLPAFVRGHLYIRSDDSEDASAEFGARFPEICQFIEDARKEPHGCVYVHCGAGISRAPTAAASYIMWKLGVSAASALRLIRSVRPSVRPNLGFVRQLQRWETLMHQLPGGASSEVPFGGRGRSRVLPAVAVQQSVGAAGLP